jgi:hypothetical protein
VGAISGQTDEVRRKIGKKEKGRGKTGGMRNRLAGRYRSKGISAPSGANKFAVAAKR